jgi:hypothetical protein
VAGDELIKRNKVASDFSITAEMVGGDMTVNRNGGPGTKEVDGNTVTGTLKCRLNTHFQASGNTAAQKKGQCK